MPSIWPVNRSIALSPVQPWRYVKKPWLLGAARFIESIFTESGISCYYDESLPQQEEYLTARINESTVAFVVEICASDDQILAVKQQIPGVHAIFQTYTTAEALAKHENAFPLGPTSYGEDNARSWDKYWRLLGEVEYKASGLDVLAFIGFHSLNDENWAPSLDQMSTWRKDAVRVLDASHYYRRSQTMSMYDFLSQVSSVKAAVGCSGTQIPCALDRTVIQLMSMGCCVIQPRIEYPFPDGGFIPDVHYLRCQANYSDVPGLLDGTPPETLMAIGENAKRYFKHHLTPVSLLEHIFRCINRLR